MFRPLTPAIALLLWASLIVVCPARAVTFDTTTVAALGPMAKAYPRLALDALTGEPHLLYSTPATILHAARLSGAWSYEVVSSGSSTVRPFWAIGPSGQLHVGYFKTNGRFVCATRSGTAWPGTWTEDSSRVDVAPCSSCRQWLAADPVTGEPALAYTLDPPTGAVVRYATRLAGTWSTTDVDAAGVSPYPLALALDGQGRPYVACTDTSFTELRVAFRVSAAAPFDHEVATTLTSPAAFYSLALAVDLNRQQPRAAFFTWGEPFYVGYAARDGDAGTWTTQLADSISWYAPRPVSLALDGAGNPTIAYTIEENILAAARPGSAARPSGADAPDEGGTTGAVLLASRTGGAGPGAFDVTGVPVHDAACESGALAVSAGGGIRLAMRRPDRSAGSPYSVVFAETPDPVAVPHADAAGFALAPPWPDPARAGEAVRLAFVLPRAERVTIELLDLAGRRVAQAGGRRCPAGPNTLSWTPGPLPAGLYWLRVRTGSGLAAARRWTVLE